MKSNIDNVVRQAQRHPALLRVLVPTLKNVASKGKATAYACIGGKEYIDCGSWTTQA